MCSSDLIIEQLKDEIKSQAEHIKLLQQCDDSSTEVIARLDVENEKFKLALQDISNAEDSRKITGIGFDVTINIIAKIALGEI